MSQVATSAGSKLWVAVRTIATMAIAPMSDKVVFGRVTENEFAVAFRFGEQIAHRCH